MVPSAVQGYLNVGKSAAAYYYNATKAQENLSGRPMNQ
jgi:hypothetical protein